MNVTKLIVGGFKSIRERTEIPIAPLTFLFGPNSAGKSAVLMALKTLQQKFSFDEEYEYRSNRMAMLYGLRRDSYRHGPLDEYGNPLIEPMILGVEMDPFSNYGLGGETSEGDDYEMAVELFRRLDHMRVRLELREDGNATPPMGAMAVDGQELVAFVQAVSPGETVAANSVQSTFVSAPAWEERLNSWFWGVLRVHLSHAFWGSSPLSAKLLELRQLAECSTSPFIRQALYLEADTLSIRTGTNEFHASGWGIDVQDTLFSEGAADDEMPAAVARRELQRAIALVDSVCAAVSLLVQQVKFTAREELNFAQVAGDRKILQQADVSTEFDATSTARRGPRIQDYAAWLGVIRAEAEDVATEGMAAAEAVDDFVNDSLRLDFFPARGYQVKPEVSHITITGLLNQRHGWDVDDERLKVSLFLEDANGRRLDFSDVGSGVSYVMPVLVSLWGADRSWIEQPELHLHPAAQCELGDVVIRAFNRGRFSIIETHSEHMLLRVLKRVRMTSDGKALDPELKCLPEAVSVLYFDPLPDGSTAIRQLRVSRGGDFMDRWPAGFFEERDRELFDE